MNVAAARLGLGTVQFGLDYGITNAAGKVGGAGAAAILGRCATAGIEVIDTAHLYGDSEAVIGRNAPADRFRIVTKTPKFAHSESSAEAVRRLREAFGDSLRNLRRESVHGLLLHDSADLLGPHGSALWSVMEELKGAGSVQALGVSVYEGEEIDSALARFPLDIVQLPWNPLDTRLEDDGQLAGLASRGVEVHARSLFLQGLLLQDVTAIPARFGPLREAVREMVAVFDDSGLSRLEGILAMAFARPEISHFIVGVTSAAELDAILLAGKTASGVQSPPILPKWRYLGSRHLNPARWAELG
jgi:aryl-alcohol dehydrogenase-like predicted oxidoreductase